MDKPNHLQEGDSEAVKQGVPRRAQSHLTSNLRQHQRGSGGRGEIKSEYVISDFEPKCQRHSGHKSVLENSEC